MESLPPVELGAIIFGALALTFVARPFLEKALVEGRDLFVQPRAQFLLDLGLGLTACVLATTYNTLYLKFPLLSGVKLATGMAAMAFFMAMDSSISRQRIIIDRACTKNWRTPPERTRPMARKFAVLALGLALIMATLIAVILINGIDWLSGYAHDPQALLQAKRAVSLDVAFVTAVLLVGVGVLIVRYSENLRRLLAEQTTVLEAVSRGELGRFIPVATADEFGIIAARTNSMIEGLRHRVELMDAMSLAEAVQKSLLPASIPDLPGVSMAARAIYSGQTGGDYYDFLQLPGGKLAVVVADVSGHGLDAAMLMASARGFLRQGALCLSDPSRIITTLNRHLARDVAGSGRFITLFMLVLDPVAGRLEWIRAGHDPALVYDPTTGTFDELMGRGLPLAVDEESTYLPGWMPRWPSGKVIVLGTDGLWESFGPDGSMYGKNRLREVIRANGEKPAEEILDAILLDWSLFLDGSPQEDDVTLVVIRVDAAGATPQS